MSKNKKPIMVRINLAMIERINQTARHRRSAFIVFITAERLEWWSRVVQGNLLAARHDLRMQLIKVSSISFAGRDFTNQREAKNPFLCPLVGIEKQTISNEQLNPT